MHLRNRFLLLVVGLVMALVCAREPAQESTPDPQPTQVVAQTSEPVDLSSVTIGDLTWTARNLAVTQFRNGDPIPHIEDEAAWEKASRNQQPAWCYHQNDPAKGEAWGVLYNWYAVTDRRGLAPEGWHVPTKDELNALLDALGGSTPAGKLLKDPVAWEEADRTGFSGFDAPPSEGRFDDGDWIDFDGIAYFWGAPPGNGRGATYMAIAANDPDAVVASHLNRGYGFAVRLVQD